MCLPPTYLFPLDYTFAYVLHRYCVVIVNMLGNGVSTSPSQMGGLKGWGWPSVLDNVRLQTRLLDYLGVTVVQLAFGYSMGAMQVRI